MLGFGSLLKAYLDYYNISTKEFSDRLNISENELNNILNNSVGIDEN